MSVGKTKARVRRRTNDERGQALVEFAVLLPVIALVLVGVIEVGIWLYTDINLTSGTREAGRLLSSATNDSSAIQDVKDRLAQNLDANIDPSKLQYSFSPAPAASTPLWPTGTTVTMTVTYPDQLNLMGLSLGAPNMSTSAQVRIQ